MSEFDRDRRRNGCRIC